MKGKNPNGCCFVTTPYLAKESAFVFGRVVIKGTNARQENISELQMSKKKTQKAYS